MGFEAFPQCDSIKQNRQKVNTIHFTKIKQDGNRRPKNFPVKPIPVWELTKALAIAQNIQPRRRKLQSDETGLDHQKEAK